MNVEFDVKHTRLQTFISTPLFHQWSFADGTIWTTFHRLGDDYYLRFPEIADFELSQDGRRVKGWPVPGVSDATIQHLYLNQVLPLALGKQGKLVLHGSAVEINGKSIAFIGESGRGKSTLAASFATSGSPFLTDDGLLLEHVGDQYHVIPSHPSVRLWSDSEDALIGKNVLSAPAVQFTNKARFMAGRDVVFCKNPRELCGVYFLGEGAESEVQFQRIKPAQVLIELVKNSFLLGADEKDALAYHFDQLSRLSILPIHYKLDYPRRYENLPHLRASIIQHVLEEKGSS